jgi:hypothetical protein
MIERSLLSPDDNIKVDFQITGPGSKIIITRDSDSAGGLANNGSGFNGLPYIPKPPSETPTPTPIYDQAMVEVNQLTDGRLYSPDPQLRQEAFRVLEIKSNELQKIYQKYPYRIICKLKLCIL